MEISGRTTVLNASLTASVFLPETQPEGARAAPTLPNGNVVNTKV